MADLLAALRLQIYGQWIATGRAPAEPELSAALHEDVAAGLDELAAAHTIVLEPGTRTIRMAHPFSAVPTAYRVASGGVSYWANCAWDSLGIAAMLGRDTEAMAQCADCGERVDLSVRGGAVCDDAVIHLVVPARHFWDDIVFT
jgi:Alkylmercury lyase